MRPKLARSVSVHEPWQQARYGVRFAWGPAGAACVGRHGGVLVIVDVLSFTTSVGVAVERGVAVYPAAARDAGAVELAETLGAVLAVDRREVTTAQPWSLSPAALRSARAPARLVLPSPSGCAIAAAAGGRVVVAASLGNARAVAAWMTHRQDGPFAVIAAGERWPDGSLCPALEDLLGAGAVLAALAEHGGCSESPEAAAARAAYETSDSIPDDVRGSASGVELVTSGFSQDVDVAVEIDASDVVPVLPRPGIPTRLTRALSRGTRSTVTVRASECSSSPQRVSCSGSGSRCPSRSCWARHEPASCASLGRVPACPGCVAQG